MIQEGHDRKSFNSIFVTEIVTLYIRIELLLPPYHIPISFFSLISIYFFFLSSFLILITSFHTYLFSFCFKIPKRLGLLYLTFYLSFFLILITSFLLSSLIFSVCFKITNCLGLLYPTFYLSFFLILITSFLFQFTYLFSFVLKSQSVSVCSFQLFISPSFFVRFHSIISFSHHT
jgi:hypothetical protein